jgi:hypothetical protein
MQGQSAFESWRASVFAFGWSWREVTARQKSGAVIVGKVLRVGRVNSLC